MIGESRSPGGRGVRGFASATSGTNYGVLGQSASGAGVGVQGIAPPPGGVGVLGSGPTGVRGVSAAPAGRGVVGSATATTGPAYGVLGITTSEDGAGVRGEARNTTGAFVPGVQGRSDAGDGIGVLGAAYGAGGIGVLARGEYGLDVEGTRLGARLRATTAFFPDAVALEVVGRAVFSTAGVSIVPGGAGGVIVQPGIFLAPEAWILAMLQADPGANIAISYVVKNSPSEFVIALTGAPQFATPVAWFVIG